VSKVVVSIQNVKKQFHLPREKEDSIKLKILNSFKKNRNTGHDVYKALNGINIEIKDGDFIGILGRNGAGKSTLLKIIAEIYQPSEGSVKVQGKLVPFIELGVGFNPNLSGRDNVYLNGAMLGFSRDEIDKMYDSIVEFAELEEFMDQKLKNYSSGQRVRLAFSMAIRADGDILLLDEVLAVGDAAFQQKCYDYFESLKQNKKTIILVSHSMGVIRQYADRGVLIDGGKVVFDGTGEEAADKYMELFEKPKLKKPEPEPEKPKDRLGSFDIKISKVNLISTTKKITVNCFIKAKNSIRDDIIIAADIYDHAGRLVGGIDDSMQQKNKIAMSSGETKSTSLIFENILGSGDYSITLALKSANTGEVYDFWKKAVSFTNNVDVSDYFPVALPVEIKEK